MVGVCATGRIVNARGARSQLLGGMIMGLSMALQEQVEMDARFVDFANHDLVGEPADLPSPFRLAARGSVRKASKFVGFLPLASRNALMKFA